MRVTNKLLINTSIELTELFFEIISKCIEQHFCPYINDTFSTNKNSKTERGCTVDKVWKLDRKIVWDNSFHPQSLIRVKCLIILLCVLIKYHKH